MNLMESTVRAERERCAEIVRLANVLGRMEEAKAMILNGTPTEEAFAELQKLGPGPAPGIYPLSGHVPGVN
jgi:hypothetical protein